MFQIGEQQIADIILVSGDRYEYRVTESQIIDAEGKMAEDAGILRWVPNFGGPNARPEVINVRHVARLSTRVEQVTDDFLVQLWYRRDNGRLYLGDPDDARHLFYLDGLTEGVPEGVDPWQHTPRSFAEDVHGLLSGDVGLSDLTTAVGRPDPAGADMLLAAEGTKRGSKLVATPDDLAQLDPAGRSYFAGLLPPPQRKRGPGEPARTDA